MNVNRYKYYIGANNETGYIEVYKAKDTLKRYGINAYNITFNTGMYKGLEERGFVIEILDFKTVGDLFYGLFQCELENVLGQNEILLIKENVEVL